MASALVHMSCPTLRNDVIGMEPSSLNDALHGLERGKRDHDIDDLDRCQVKKRRKQSKPNRIASTESFSEGWDSQPTVWTGIQDNAIPPKENDSPASQEAGFSESSKENKKDEPTTYSDTEESTGENSSGLYNSNVKKEFSFPLNLSQKTPSPQESIYSFSSTLDERAWYKSNENASILYNINNPNPDVVNLKTQAYQNSIFQPTQACNMILPGVKRILVGNYENQIGSPHRIFNPEAFCDLCNKEFCNKYFLKTHKANKHGIYMENVGPSPIENIPTLPLINYFSSSLTNVSVSSNQQPSKKTSSNSSSCANRSSSSMRAFCNICQREFCNKYFVRRHKAKIHGIVETNSEGVIKPMCQEKGELEIEPIQPGPSTAKAKKDFMPEKDLSNAVPEEEKTTVKKEDDEPEELDSPHDALSMLVSSWRTEELKDCSRSPERAKKPISGPTAFCDICCKEYCNKSFLRVHMQKCHGMSFSEKDEKTKEVDNFNSGKHNQAMPLNLILRENNKNIVELEKSLSCNLCNYQFSDKQSLKIHHDQAHKNEKQFPPTNNFAVPDNQGNKDNLELSNSRIASYSNHSVNQQDNYGFHKKNSSPNIQKMNSMLLRLNQHIPFDNYTCEVCDLDFGSMPSLENHIIRDHSALIEEISNSFYEENTLPANNEMNKLECSTCQKCFASIPLLELHFAEKHATPESKITVKTNENQDLNPQISIPSDRQVVHTPTSSFCEICKKELCNKYFMKTHMQRMHGISIENGAQIGGVVCDICNKELCSKYFLRVHKQNSHGIVEEAFLPQIGYDIKIPISNADNALRPNDNDLSHRYFSHFTEVCSICSRRFRSAKWLKAHLLNDHGEEGKDKWREVQIQNGNKIERQGIDSGKKLDPTYSNKPLMHDFQTSDIGPSTSETNSDMIPTFLARTSQKQYHCTQCPFSSPVLALLIVHERTHLTNATDFRDHRCPICSVMCENYESLEKHLTLKHNSPSYSPKKPVDETIQYNENTQVLQYEESNGAGISPAKEDNNLEESINNVKTQNPTAEACFKCNQCLFVTQNVELYNEHVKNEHKADGAQMDYLQIIRDTLLHIAHNSNMPASFAVPNNFGNFMMQPFVLEDKAYGENSPSTFLSSLVFLPVKERLSKPVTASFKLTPT